MSAKILLLNADYTPLQAISWQRAVKLVNTVAACFPCNNAKGNRTPVQAGLTLCKKPVRPTLFEFVRINLGDFSYADLMTSQQ